MRGPEAVLDGVAEACRDAFGDRLVAAYALGSLAHGGFSPLVSDIDVGLVLRDPFRAEDGATIRGIAALDRRLSIFWGTPASLRGGRDEGRFPPLDRLDLIENGRLLAGSDVRGTLPRPDRRRLLAGAAGFALELLSEESFLEELCAPERIVARGPRHLTKFVLFPVRFRFTAATGRVGTNDAAARWYVDGGHGAGADLVTAALAWRRTPPADEAAAAALLESHAAGLYREFLEDYAGRLDRPQEARLAEALRDWQVRLGDALRC